MKRLVLFTASCTIMLAALSAALGVRYGVPTAGGQPDPPDLTCAVKQEGCGTGEIEVFRMSGLTNAHAQTAEAHLTTYANSVCCSGPAGLTTDCSGDYATVLRLWEADNAHVAQVSDLTYPTEVCLSAPDATAQCQYGPSCDAGYACIAAISDTTNAHVEECDGAGLYPIKVCCAACADDGDGIVGRLDTDLCVFSDEFTDVPLGGTTFGEITKRSGLFVEVTDKLNSTGVRIEASGTGNKKAQVRVCDKPPTTVNLDAGDWAVVTCSTSATLEVLSGPIEAGFGTISADLPTGTTATIDEVAPGTFDVSNSPTSTDPIVVGGLVIDPGETAAGVMDTDADGLVDSVDPNPNDPLGDADVDGLTDAAEVLTYGTDPFNPDTDGDGCADGEEPAGAPAPKPGSTAADTDGDTIPDLGYDPTAWHDFYDVAVPASPDPTPNGPRNGAITFGDVLAVLFYVGTYDGDGGNPNANGVAYDVDKDSDTVKDGQDYDRSPSAEPNPPWDVGPPNGGVAMGDVLAVLAQVGLSCVGLP